MTAETLDTLTGFDRSPVPKRSAVAVRPAGSKRLSFLSDYVDDFDPFAGVFTLFSHLLLLAALFVLHFGADRRPSPPPVALQVMVVPEPDLDPVIQTPAPPPTTSLRPRDSVSLGRGNDPSDTGNTQIQTAGRPITGPLSAPSENRILNEAPKPTSAETVEPKASTAATPVPFSNDAIKNNAALTPRSAAADTKPAGTVTETVVPTAPDESEPGGPKNAGEGAMMAAGLIKGARPDYPLTARKQGIEGTVMLRVRVGPDGRTVSVEVIQSSGHAILDQAARNGVARWRFTPARRATGAIASVIDVPIEFKLNN